jgi:MFS family permease
MGESLKLQGRQLSIAVAVFYISYVLTELFANLTLRFTKLNLLLGGTMFAWYVASDCSHSTPDDANRELLPRGTLCLLTGLVVHDFKDLLILRFFLGIAEGFVIPGKASSFIAVDGSGN